MIKDEMHGVEVKKILWVNCNGDRTIEAKGDKKLTVSCSYHGDRDEHWIIESENAKEIARHNVKHIASITWV